jgi:hypothetical protein
MYEGRWTTVVGVGGPAVRVLGQDGCVAHGLAPLRPILGSGLGPNLPYDSATLGLALICGQVLQALQWRDLMSNVVANSDGKTVLLMELEHQRYRAGLAERHHERIDPENRLVAPELERRWNTPLPDVLVLEAGRKKPLAPYREASPRGARPGGTTYSAGRPPGDGTPMCLPSHSPRGESTPEVRIHLLTQRLWYTPAKREY